MATEDEKRLERYKIVSSIILAGVGLFVSYILAVNAHHQEAEAKRIEYRVKFYESVGADLNALYAFVCRVGDYSSMPPSVAGANKRKLDASFVINIPLMSANTYGAYQRFINSFIQSSGIEGVHFRFRMRGGDYSVAYQNRRKEYRARGGSAAGEMPEVSDSELHEWFADDTVPPRSSDQVKRAYADLLHDFSEDSGFGAAKIDPSQLTCFGYADTWH